MRHAPFLPLICTLSLFGAGLACIDDASTDSDDGSTETGDAGDGDGGDGDGDGDGDGGDGDGDGGDGDGDGGDGDGDAGDGDGDGGDGDGDGGDGDGDADCQVWEITYNLNGSTFEVTDTPGGGGDQLNTVADPDDADDKIGPGQFVLHFQDVDGAPGGQVFMHSYSMKMHFVTGALGVTVTTDLEQSAGPEECGITSGTLDDSSLAWMPAAIVDHHSVGSVTCNGLVGCAIGGLPNGEPVEQDETVDQPLSDFEFAEDLSSFTMAKTEVPGQDNAKVFWTYQGNEDSRELVAAPECLCR